MLFRGSLAQGGRVVARHVEGELQVDDPLPDGRVPLRGHLRASGGEAVGEGEYLLTLDDGRSAEVTVTSTRADDVLAVFTGTSSAP